MNFDRASVPAPPIVPANAAQVLTQPSPTMQIPVSAPPTTRTVHAPKAPFTTPCAAPIMAAPTAPSAGGPPLAVHSTAPSANISPWTSSPPTVAVAQGPALAAASSEIRVDAQTLPTSPKVESLLPMAPASSSLAAAEMGRQWAVAPAVAATSPALPASSASSAPSASLASGSASSLAASSASQTLPLVIDLTAGGNEQDSLEADGGDNETETAGANGDQVEGSDPVPARTARTETDASHQADATDHEDKKNRRIQVETHKTYTEFLHRLRVLLLHAESQVC